MAPCGIFLEQSNARIIITMFHFINNHRLQWALVLAGIALLTGGYLSYDYGWDSAEWGGKLRNELAGCNKITIVQRYQNMSDISHIHISDGKRIDICSAQSVSEFITDIRINAWKSQYRCACSGNLRIVFFNDNDAITTMTMHHGTSLRWRNWEGDGRLSDWSRRRIHKILEENGFTANEIERL